MSTCVCVCVCLSVPVCLQNHARDLCPSCACCLWPWLGPPPAGWRNPKGKGQVCGFLPNWQCIVQHCIWDTYKRDAVWDDEWAWPEEQCATWCDDPKGEEAILGKHVPDKPKPPMNCELDWPIQRPAHDRQTLDCKLWTSLLSAAKGRWDCTPRAKSNIYDCLVEVRTDLPVRGLRVTVKTRRSRKGHLCRRCRHLANSTKHKRRLWFSPTRSIIGNMTSSTKPEVHHVSHYRQRTSHGSR